MVTGSFTNLFWAEVGLICVIPISTLLSLTRNLFFFFRVYKIRSVLAGGPLMVLNFLYFVVTERFENLFKTASMKTLTYCLCHFSGMLL